MKICILFSLLIFLVGLALGLRSRERILKLESEIEDASARNLLPERSSSTSLSTRALQLRERPVIHAGRKKLIDDLMEEAILWLDTKGSLPPLQHTELLTKDELFMFLIALRDHPEIEALDWMKVMDAIAKKIAKTDPEKALLILSERFTQGQKKPQRILGDALITLAKKDHEAVIQWLQENEMNLDVRSSGNSGVVKMLQTLVEEDLESAMNMVFAFGTRNSEVIIKKLAPAFRDIQNVAVVVGILNSQEESRWMRKAFLSGILRGPLGRKPIEVQTWLDSDDLTEADREFVFYGLNGWSGNVNGETPQWLSVLSGRDNKYAMSAEMKLLDRWASNDFVAAGEWINQQVPGAARDRQASIYADALAGHEPQAATEWAASLPESPQRTKILQRIHHAWSRSDPEAAAKFAQEWQLSFSTRR